MSRLPPLAFLLLAFVLFISAVAAEIPDGILPKRQNAAVGTGQTTNSTPTVTSPAT
ncbi:hypothetical protein LTR28_013231, partial [Elasticomyces elasticus]